MQPNFELLKEAYAIIDGIPDERININFFGNLCAFEQGASNCRTIACALGWIGMHPKFVALGITTRTHSLIGTSQRVFGIDAAQWQDLFSNHYSSKYDNAAPPELTDKQLFLYRVRCFLKEHNQL